MLTLFPGASLEQIHIFALAHILRRPIIVYGIKFVKSFRGENIGLARFQGEGSAICHDCFIFPQLPVRDQPFVTVACLPSAPCQGSTICHGCFVFPLLPVRDQRFVTIASSSLCSLSGISHLSRLLRLPSAPCQGSAICHGCFVFPLLPVRVQRFVTIASSSLCSLSGISHLSRLLRLPSTPWQGSAICHGCFIFHLLPGRVWCMMRISSYPSWFCTYHTVLSFCSTS